MTLYCRRWSRRSRAMLHCADEQQNWKSVPRACPFMCHVLARLFRVTCCWPHQELQATSLKFAPRALCSAIVVYTHLCFIYHFHVGCVVSEFVLGAHSWLFGERRLLQLLALGHLFLEVMETEMGGADGSSDAQRRRSRSPRPSDCSSLRLSTLHRKLMMMMMIWTQAPLN